MFKFVESGVIPQGSCFQGRFLFRDIWYFQFRWRNKVAAALFPLNCKETCILTRLITFMENNYCQISFGMGFFLKHFCESKTLCSLKMLMLVKNCIRSLKTNIKKDVRVQFVVTYNTSTLGFYTNTKDRIDKLAHSCIEYKFCCPVCSNSSIGKRKESFSKE